MVKNGETLKTGKYNFLVSFNCEKKEIVNSKKNFNTIPKLEIKNDNCNLPNINRDIFGDIGAITGFGLGIGSITREKIDHLKKNLDWILYLYKDENIDQFIDYLAVQMKVNEKYFLSEKDGRYRNTLNFQKEVFETFLKIHNLSDVKLSCSEKEKILENYIKDLDFYIKGLDFIFEPTEFKDPESFLKKNHQFPIEIEFIPKRKHKYIKRYSDVLRIKNDVYKNT